jgi:methionyl-tRNA formyltransferase
LKIVFVGTPEIAAHYLNSLAENHQVVLVITQSAKPKGRGLNLQASAVSKYATRHNLSLIETNNINEEQVVQQIKSSGAQLGVVVAFGQIIKNTTRAALPKGFINLHFSLLPVLRGADPVAAAIRMGQTSSGVSVFELNDELDAGPIYSQIEIPITSEDTGTSLFQKLITVGENALDDALAKIESEILPQNQNGTPSFANKSTTTDYRIDWQKDAESIRNLVRSQVESKMAWTTLNDQVIKISRVRITEMDENANEGEIRLADEVLVKTGTSFLEILELIPAGKKQMSGSDWARGLKIEKPIFK